MINGADKAVTTQSGSHVAIEEGSFEPFHAKKMAELRVLALVS